MNNTRLERLFQATAGALILTAAYFLWRGDIDRVFVIAVLGSLSFFISVRFQVKERLEKRETERRGLERSGPRTQISESPSLGTENSQASKDFTEKF